MTYSVANSNSPARIVFISWKDIKNPQSGGAELLQHEVSMEYVRQGSEVIHLVPGFAGCAKEEMLDGIRIIRIGQSMFSFFSLASYYLKNLKEENDVLVDVFNCFSSFTWLMRNKPNTFFMIHHVQNEIWFHQLTPPFVPPLNVLGWLLEKFQLILIALLFRGQTITISESTKSDLLQYGFDPNRVSVFRESIEIPHLEDISQIKNKEEKFTVLFLSGLRKMKRPMHALQGFKLFHDSHPDSQMWIVGGGGSGSQENDLKEYIAKHNLQDCVTMFGKVSLERKIEVMQRATVMLSTSVKEGWGLIVTEANSQGLPVISYDVPGLRDSNKEGILTKPNTPRALSEELTKLYKNPDLIEKIKLRSWQYSKQFTTQTCFDDFNSIIQPNPNLEYAPTVLVHNRSN